MGIPRQSSAKQRYREYLQARALNFSVEDAAHLASCDLVAAAGLPNFPSSGEILSILPDCRRNNGGWREMYDRYGAAMRSRYPGIVVWAVMRSLEPTASRWYLSFSGHKYEWYTKMLTELRAFAHSHSVED